MGDLRADQSLHFSISDPRSIYEKRRILSGTRVSLHDPLRTELEHIQHSSQTSKVCGKLAQQLHAGQTQIEVWNVRLQTNCVTNTYQETL